ncbi:hypothetical protein [Mycobacterium paraffinicum]|uniref:hypothetical protein n=1 Tax=Mycobacterium paraffinicum TaxID=53378 RepID=UPI00142E6169|nr:hypothetical protein [Mycobacterium paraffinicum]
MNGDHADWFGKLVFDAKHAQRRGGATEFSHGPGLTPPGLEDAAPAEGGRYHGKTPRQ